MASRNFEQSYKKHLVPAQRREILDTLRATLRRDTTLGEIVDAAGELGWGEAMGDLRLSDLAESLLAGDADDVELSTDEANGRDAAFGEAHEGEVVATPKTGKKAAKKKAVKKKAVKTTDKPATKKAAAKTPKPKSATRPTASKKVGKKAGKKAAKKAGKKTGRK